MCVSHSSVATQLRRDGIFNNYFIVNCLKNVTVKYENWLIFAKDIDREKAGRFWDTVYIPQIISVYISKLFCYKYRVCIIYFKFRCRIFVNFVIMMLYTYMSCTNK